MMLLKTALAGGAAGAVCGLLGAGGGMILVPLLLLLTDLNDREVFSGSVFVMLPICLVSLTRSSVGIPFTELLPYLVGSAAGGTAAGLWGNRIPTGVLHRAMGILILYGGVRLIW